MGDVDRPGPDWLRDRTVGKGKGILGYASVGTSRALEARREKSDIVEHEMIH